RNIFVALVKAFEDGLYKVKYIEFESYTHLDVENMSNERKIDFFNGHWEENPDHSPINSPDDVDKFVAKYMLLYENGQVTMTTLH
ncbi:MAG: hypothetical protein ACRC9Q_03130, partial [Bacteroidales bacterium]